MQTVGGGVLLFSLSMSLTSCEDILGHWEKPTPNPITPGGGSSSDEPTPTMKATPLTLEAITAGTIKVTSPKAGMQYSLNGDAKQAVTTDAITVAIGDKVQFYGNGTSITAYYILDSETSNDTNISGGTAKVKVYGNIMSLVDETGYETATALTGDFAFDSLFKGNTTLTDISDLQLPATDLTRACYQNLFQGCTSLTTIPEKLLPATNLAVACYSHMFEGCTGLTTAPELPATTLTIYCYCTMFSGCSNLIATPHLAAPTSALVDFCYQAMFNKCTSLTKAYVKAGYKNTSSIHECELMFKDCPSSGDLYTNGDWSTADAVSGWTKHSYE